MKHMHQRKRPSKEPISMEDTKNTALFFIHIPKTAGTSFTRILENIYPPESRCDAYYIQELIETDPETLARLRLFIGHIDYAASELMPKPLNIVTFLRDPVERAISAYNHIKTNADHSQHDLFNAEVSNLYDFANHPEFSRQLKNTQTGMLGRDNRFRLLYDLAHNNQIKLNEAKYLSNFHRQHEVTKIDLFVAQERLRKMTFFGIMGWFDASISIFCDMFGVPYPDTPPRDNIAAYRKAGDNPQYDDHDMTAIRELVYIDNQLYNFSKRLFMERFGEEFEKFQEKKRKRLAG